MDSDISTRILREMERTISHERLPRSTALEKLQKEEHGDPYKILIGTILSARTRDENTTIAVRKLFKKFKNIDQLANADVEEIKILIRSTGFYNIKARRIKDVSSTIVRKFNSVVPDDIEKLLELPGVGRKTANCVLVYGYDKPSIPVDTHVHRISNRLGLVDTRNPEATEFELYSVIKKKNWIRINDTFVKYGQTICLPVKPKCDRCNLKVICKFYHSTDSNATDDQLSAIRHSSS
ncbi:MAG TPA: endonuclease III [Nitrososphaeraceae archaeon]